MVILHTDSEPQHNAVWICVTGHTCMAGPRPHRLFVLLRSAVKSAFACRRWAASDRDIVTLACQRCEQPCVKLWSSRLGASDPQEGGRTIGADPESVAGASVAEFGFGRDSLPPAPCGAAAPKIEVPSGHVGRLATSSVDFAASIIPSKAELRDTDSSIVARTLRTWGIFPQPALSARNTNAQGGSRHRPRWGPIVY